MMLKTSEVQSLEEEDRNSSSDSNSDAEIAPAPLGIAFSQLSIKFEAKYSINFFLSMASLASIEDCAS